MFPNGKLESHNYMFSEVFYGINVCSEAIMFCLFGILKGKSTFYGSSIAEILFCSDFLFKCITGSFFFMYFHVLTPAWLFTISS